MKRLLCIVSGMNTGGAETFLMKLYRNINRKMYQMDFCVNIKEEGFYDREILQMGGKIYHIPSKSENLKEFKRQLTEIVQLEKYKYVLRITSNTMGFLDLKIAKRAGAKVCAARSSNSNDAEGIKAKVVHVLGRILYSRYVDVKIAPSDLAAIYTFGRAAYRKGRVHLLKNAIDLDVYKFSPKEREKIRTEFEISNDDFVCGHIGRFSKQKNHKFLIDIFAELCKKNEKAKLLLVGNGELECEVREQCEKKNVADKVIFAGIRSDIPAILSAMDVFVFPSFYEGMPNTVIEAQATELPCVVSDTITKEVKITEWVTFESIKASAGVWADIVFRQRRNIKKETKKNIQMQGYDINKVVREFEQLIFE